MHMSVESEPLHQTHIDSLSIPNSPELLAGNSDQEKSPVLLERTPPKSRGKSRSVSSHLKRDLLPSFSGRPNRESEKSDNDEDLATKVPRWEAAFRRADCGSRSGGYKTSSFQLSPHQTSSTPVGGRKRIKETRSISTPLSSVSIGKGSSSNSDTNSLLQNILCEVKASNKALWEKVEQLEKRLDETPVSKRKVKQSPSREVRDVVRKIYHSLEDEESFGWNLDESFTSSKNQSVVDKLVGESRVHLRDTSNAMVKEAARTYYSSMVGAQRLRDAGKYNTKCLQQRRRNRLMRKLNARKAALAKSSVILDKDKAKLAECLSIDLMSSEESDEDSSFIVHPLPWRSRKACEILEGLDRKFDRKKSKRSKLMTFQRIEGCVSTRPKPKKGSFSDWILNN